MKAKRRRRARTYSTRIATERAHLLSGSLSHQIEHHLFPDIPAHRYGEIAVQVRDICERYGLPYNAGSLHKQFGSVVKKIVRLALPGSGNNEAEVAAPVTSTPADREPDLAMAA
jgi:fatty acid desaturase